MISRKQNPYALMVTLGLLASAPALAHHSAVGYDTSRRIEIVGIVKEAAFRNPHGELELLEVEAEGYEAGLEWEVETAAANLLRRRDWDFDKVEEGMTIRLLGHPSRDGKPHLYLREIYFEDGTVFGDPEGQDKALD